MAARPFDNAVNLQTGSQIDLQIDSQIAEINRRLKVACLGLKVERRGDKLGLRGMLPPRPDSPRIRSYQQRIPLGLPADEAGLKQVEKTVKVVAAQLIFGNFDWYDYISTTAKLRRAEAGLSEQIAAFEVYFFQQAAGKSRPSSIRTTWQKAYVPYFRRLQEMAEQQPGLSLAEAIYATVQSTRANSRSRQVCCTALDALANFLHISLPTPLRSFWGNYGNSKTSVRSLPSDQDILSAYEKIPHEGWKFVYGIMATYGLRNHEVFFCDYEMLANGDEEAAIEVLETTKTGQHDVWPFYPEWVDAFSLRDIHLPKINTDLSTTTLQLVGQQVSKQFKRYEIPFSPYDLRHAWAVRTVHVGLPDTVSARMMGHSVAIHNRTYHKWITRRDQRAAVRAAMGNR